MPIYEYVCLDCRSRSDALRPMAQADSPLTCRECGSQHSSRTLSLFNAHAQGRPLASSRGGCGSCGGGHCSSCAN